MTKKQTKELRTYLIEFENNEKRRITVPADWKVTFGPIAIVPKSQLGGKVPIALRFYEDETRQRAIFVEVRSFRDLSIPVEELKVSRRDKMGIMEVDGMRRNVSVSAVMKEWVDPDAETNCGEAESAFKQLESEWEDS